MRLPLADHTCPRLRSGKGSVLFMRIPISNPRSKSRTSIEQGISNDEVFLLQYSIFLVLRFDVFFERAAEGLIYGGFRFILVRDIFICEAIKYLRMFRL